MVKITPAATASPEEAAVWIMLFSRMFERANRRRIAIDATAAGIEAETVMPANRPKYALAVASTAARRIERRMALMVISGRLTSAGTTGASSSGITVLEEYCRSFVDKRSATQ